MIALDLAITEGRRPWRWPWRRGERSFTGDGLMRDG